MNSLSVHGLTKKYPGFVLDNVSFSVETGRIMGLIGRNGAGKSTTLKSILRLVSTDGGSVEVLGRDFAEDEAECKQRIGVVLGGIDFYTNKRLRDITAVTRRFYTHWDDGQYRRLMSDFGLDEAKRVKELSAGMRVKYLVALALSHSARLLIFDEPTSGLDPVSRDELLELFKKLASDGISILFSTHITSDLEHCADDITYIKGGNVLLSAEKGQFVDEFRSKFGLAPDAALTLEDIMLRVERGGGAA